MNKILPIVLSILAFTAITGLIAGYIYLSSQQGRLADKVKQSQTELLTTRDQYAKCYNSVNYGKSMVMDVSLTYLRYDSTDEDVEKLHQIESDFMTDVKNKCSAKISSYENEYAEFIRNIDEYEKSGWINFLIGGSIVTVYTTDLNPPMVRMKEGNALTNLIFTKEEVDQYFAERV